MTNDIGLRAVLLSACFAFGCSKETAVEPVPPTPVVRIVTPISPVETLDSLYIQIEATDDKGVVKVEIYIDGSIPVGGTLIFAPYFYLWNTQNLPDSSGHTISAKAYDADGNVTSTPTSNILLYRLIAPTNIKIVSISETEMRLEWKDNTRFEKGFIVEKKSDSGTYGVTATLPENAVAWSDNSLDKKSSYAYRVRAFTDKNMSNYSAEMKISFFDDYPLQRTLTGHISFVRSVAFSPDGQTLASGGDKSVKMWNVADGSLIRTLSGYTSYVNSVSFASDGQTLASADTATVLWRVVDGTFLRRLRGFSSNVHAVFSSIGQTLGTGHGGSYDWAVRLWSIDGTVLQTMNGHASSVQAVAFSKDGSIIASGGNDKTVKLWQTADGTLVRTLQGHTGTIYCLAFGMDGQVIASGGDDHTVRLCNTQDGSLIRTLSVSSSTVTSIAFSPDGQTIATGSGDAAIRLWRLSDGMITRTLSGHTSDIGSVAYSPDGKTFASGSSDYSVKVWRVEHRWVSTP